MYAGLHICWNKLANLDIVLYAGLHICLNELANLDFGLFKGQLIMQGSTFG